jgi:hypothetical protein
MGQWHSFECPACGYRAEVSGGGDAGMRCCTQTILCETCKKLYDVTSALAPLFEPIPLRCPKSKKHVIRVWQDPGPCPGCGIEMRNLGPTAIWD